MQLIHTATELRDAIREQRRNGKRIGFVPTMGNLHAGHHSLVGLARAQADFVVASIFVNPTQFGPREDFARYPRTPDDDAASLSRIGCDLLFMPAVETMYPLGLGNAVRIAVPGIADILDGASRPGHFDGVATVVARLFNLVQADVAVFGRKDYQQWLVVRALVRDLAFPLEILGAPIVRENDGLAMSSRNQYLDAGQRARAPLIHEVLRWIAERVRHGTQSLTDIEAAAAARLGQAGFVPDYVVVRRGEDLGIPPPAQRDQLVALVAARLGAVRLIDNLEIDAE